jgi:hypothetical protein
VSASIGKKAMQQVREQLPAKDLEPLSEWERQGASFLRGRDEGLEQGRAEALAGMRTTLRTVVEVRGMTIDDQTQSRIAGCDDIDALRNWIARAATVTSACELFLDD